MATNGKTYKSKAEKRTYYFVHEGRLTEPDYLDILGKIYKNVRIVSIATRHGDPKSLLKKIRLVSENMGTGPHCFVLMSDRNSWPLKFFEDIWRWVHADMESRRFVFSNPCFELWLLRHYENGVGASTCEMCRRRLVRHDGRLAGKAVPLDAFERGDVEAACRRSEGIGAMDWRVPGFVNMHLLVREIEAEDRRI